MQQGTLDIFPKPDIELWQGDCLELMSDISDVSVDLVFVDPPYNIKKAEWDKIEDYQAWCELWVAECSRVLEPNGAFWVSHSEPLILSDISKAIQSKGRNLINWITWDKLNGNPAHQATGGPMIGNTMMKGLRSFQWMAEYLIYHAVETNWEKQCEKDRDKERGCIFEPLRKYLNDERIAANIPHSKIISCLNMVGHDSHFFSPIQWKLPSKNQYEKMRALFNTSGNDYLYREYEDLLLEYNGLRHTFDRSGYENLRYTFNNPGKVSSVWQIAPAKANGHPTPKPEKLLKRIIETTSNEGDTILDPMMGSGTTGKMAKLLNRNFIGIEKDPDYFEIAKRRIGNFEGDIVKKGEIYGTI